MCLQVGWGRGWAAVGVRLPAAEGASEDNSISTRFLPHNQSSPAAWFRGASGLHHCHLPCNDMLSFQIPSCLRQACRRQVHLTCHSPKALSILPTLLGHLESLALTTWWLTALLRLSSSCPGPQILHATSLKCEPSCIVQSRNPDGGWAVQGAQRCQVTGTG